MIDNLDQAFTRALDDARAQFRARNPQSAAAFASAAAHLPGGSTRSVLYYEPFPLTVARGEGSQVWDIDGHRYVDFVGEFSAGLYGHSDPIIRAAIIEALSGGVVLAAPTLLEQRLAAAISARFASIDRLRFCNSGTEANLLALVTAMAHTGRKKILAFREGYHGGVLSFSGGGNPMNVPFDVVLATYNDPDSVRDAFLRHGGELAAVIVEPILGAGGNIPGTLEFLQTLRSETARAGTVLVFDEVKTSRTGAGGVQGLRGIRPDLTTLGKYLGGGLPSGAFGGDRQIMDRFDPKAAKPLKHAGTFNNNVCSMAAGLAGLTQVFTVDRANAFLADCEKLRQGLNERMAARDLPIQFVGLGSIFTIHFARRPIATPADIPPVSPKLAQLFHMECMLRGVSVVARGDIFISLPISAADSDELVAAVEHFADRHGERERRRHLREERVGGGPRLDDLGDPLLVEARGEQKELKIEFDPKDLESERMIRVDFGNGCGGASSLAWVWWGGGAALVVAGSAMGVRILRSGGGKSSVRSKSQGKKRGN